MLAMRAQEQAVLEERSEKNERRGEPVNQQSLVPPGSKGGCVRTMMASRPSLSRVD